MVDNFYKLSETDHEIIFKELKQELLESTSASLKPKIAIVAGQPGAGKSKLIDFVKNEFDNPSNVTIINGDEYRDYHPQKQEILFMNDKLYAEKKTLMFVNGHSDCLK